MVPPDMAVVRTPLTTPEATTKGFDGFLDFDFLGGAPGSDGRALRRSAERDADIASATRVVPRLA